MKWGQTFRSVLTQSRSWLKMWCLFSIKDSSASTVRHQRGFNTSAWQYSAISEATGAFHARFSKSEPPLQIKMIVTLLNECTDGAWHLQRAPCASPPLYASVFPPSLTPFRFLSLQVHADDVLTKDEQIGLLFRAKRKCEGNIRSKHKVPGE